MGYVPQQRVCRDWSVNFAESSVTAAFVLFLLSFILIIINFEFTGLAMLFKCCYCSWWVSILIQLIIIVNNSNNDDNNNKLIVTQDVLIHCLHEPIPRTVYDYLIKNNNLANYFSSLQDRQLQRNVTKPGHKPAYAPQDEAIQQVGWGCIPSVETCLELQAKLCTCRHYRKIGYYQYGCLVQQASCFFWSVYVIP